MFDEDTPWFAPKAYGIGASFPIVWQGWAMIALPFGIIAAALIPLRGHHLATIAAALLLAILSMPIYAAKTKGGWRWRWGGA